MPDIPYHITQRGNRRENVFFNDEDRIFYLSLLKEYCDKHSVEIWAYCLMTNHIHLILKPSNAEGLQKALKPLHMRYAQYINKKKGWKGHLWQGRYFSSALDEVYTYFAIRYVEQNPVRAKMVVNAFDYPWSSARAHSGLVESDILGVIPFEYNPANQQDWITFLEERSPVEPVDVLRRNIEKGLPCGETSFVEKLERLSNRTLSFKPVGRPKKG